MAEEYDDKFESEMMRLMETAILKIDGLERRFNGLEANQNVEEIALLRKDFDKFTRELKVLRKEIRANLGIDNNVIFRIIRLINRLSDIEKQVNLVDELKKEHSRIYSEVTNLAEHIDNPNTKVKLDELGMRLENLEEKAFV